MQSDINTTLAPAGIDPADIDFNRTSEWQALPTEDRPRSRNGRVHIYSTNPLRLTFTNWRTGVSGLYVENPVGREFKQSFPNMMRRAPCVPDQASYADVARTVQANLSKSHEACPEHPYLRAKQIQPHGIRQLGSSLLIPARDTSGTIWTLQTILEDGAKRFARGGKKRGCFFTIGKPSDFVFLVEGFATGASIREAIGGAVAVCFDAGNLLPVAQALAPRLPKSELIFCADNDTATPGNPGVTKASDAAAEIGGRVIYPTFPEDSPEGLSDWNDVHVHYGIDAVRDLIMEML